MPGDTWDKIKDFAMGGGALKKASGEKTPGSTVNTMQGDDPTYMMKQVAQQGAIQKAQAQAAAANATSKGSITPTPITVQKKGAKVPPPSPQDILAAPKGKK